MRFDCLFGDIHELLNFVRDIWSRYLDGKLDLAAAAVSTNTAIDLVKRARAELSGGNQVFRDDTKT